MIYPDIQGRDRPRWLLKSILQQIADMDYPLDKKTKNCCIHRLTCIQIQLREQALLQGYPQGETYQKCPSIFYIAIEMIAVKSGRCILKSHSDQEAAHMEMKASVINAILLCNSPGVREMEVRTLKDLWRALNAGVPGCRCHQCLRRQFKV